MSDNDDNGDELGELESVNLRNAWADEAQDFTPWLADKGLGLLEKTIHMELELEATEKNVGPFRADILCKNVNDDSWVVIENQIEPTDHKHLGQLLAYAAGLEAVTIVWVASQFTEEHRATLDWLNKITDDNFRFFGLEIELWRIDKSKSAPKFNVVASPNNWSKSISDAAKRITDQPTTSKQKLQYEYWNDLQKYVLNRKPKTKFYKIQHLNYQPVSLGRSYFTIVLRLYIVDERISIEFMVDHKQYGNQFFATLVEEKSVIDKEIGSAVEWRELPGTNTSKIVLFEDAAPADKSKWPDQHAWFEEKIEIFDRVFRGRVHNFDPSQLSDEEED